MGVYVCVCVYAEVMVRVLDRFGSFGWKFFNNLKICTCIKCYCFCDNADYNNNINNNANNNNKS